MYAGNYGYPNGAPPSQNPQMPGQGPGPNGNPNQQMMYNPGQYPMGAPPGAFPGGPNMMPGAGPGGGMMQNAGMPQMAGTNGQMPNYPTPYANSPYGPGAPSPVPPQMNMPPNYAAMGGNMPMGGYSMHGGQMTPQQQQQMMQRMQPPHQPNSGGMPSSSTPQRQHFPGQNLHQGPQGTPTPNNGMAPQQSQFPPPPPASQGTPQNQTPNNMHQPHHQGPGPAALQTPQTPTFPSNNQGATTNGTSGPLSPGGDSRDKERISVLLEINNELLWEATQVQHTQSIIKKDHLLARDGTDEKPEDEKLLEQDYLQLMRRLQTNLAFLAQLADKKTSQLAATQHPSYLKAPPIHTKIKLKPMPGPEGEETKVTEPTDRESTAKYFAELYAKLQALYPGVDPNKEPTFPVPGARPGPAGPNSAPGQKPGGAQASPVPGHQKTPKMAASAAPIANTAPSA